MSDLLERLRGRGWRMTAQRRVVAEVLDGEHVHLTADEVHSRAVTRLPEISRATVRAATSAVPQDPPARIPSVCARRRVMRNESRSETVT